MIFHSLSIAGANAVVPLSSGVPPIAGYVSPKPLQAKWVSLLNPTGGGTVLIGGNEVSASVGYPLIAGAGQFTPPIAIDTDFYELSNMFAYVPSGTTLNILYGG